MKIPTKNILGIPIADYTLDNIVPAIINLIKSPGKKIFFYGNPHLFNLERESLEFRKAINRASMIYPEGTGTVMASWILRRPLKGRTNFLDFMYTLFTEFHKRKWSIYILGGKEEVCQKAINNLKKKYPNIKIVGHHHGYFDKEKEVILSINSKKPKVLLVALGPPKQEIWIGKNMDKLNVKAFFGLGAAIDIIAGTMPRAPKWLRLLGLEWIFRVLLEPKRLSKKYFYGNFLFMFNVFKYYLKERKEG